MSRSHARRVWKHSVIALAAAASAPAILSPVYAQTSLTWDADTVVSAGPQDGAGTWDNQTSANWWNGTTDVLWNNSNNDIALFGAGGTGGSVTVVGSVTVGGLTINASGYNLSGGNITTGVSSTPININSTTTIGNNIDGSGAVINIAPSSTLNYTGTYSAGSNVVVTGGGTLNIGNLGAVGNLGTIDAQGALLRWGNSVTYSGGIIANAGMTNTITLGGNGSLNGNITGGGTLVYNSAAAGNILSINGDNSAFTGTLSVLNSGTIRFTSTGAGLPNALVDLGSTGVIGARLSSATVSLGALKGDAGSRLTGGIGTSGNVTYEIGTLGVNSTFNGVINDLGGSTITTVRKVGPATLFLGGSNSYTGTTTIAGGTLALLSTGTINGTKNIFVNNGGTYDVSAIAGGYSIPAGQALTGDGGQVVGNVNVSSPTGIVNAGTSAITDSGQITFRNNLTVSGGTLAFDINGGTADVDNILGTLTLTSGNIFVDPHGTTGDFTLITYPTAQTPTTANTPLLFASRAIGNLTTGSGTIGVHIASLSAPADITWNSTSDGNWDVQVHANWKSSIANPDKFFANDNVNFGDPTGLQTTVTKVGLLQPGSLNLTNNTGAYTIGSSGSIGDKPDGSALTLNKTGTGTVILSSANSYTGGTNIQAGTLQIGSGGALGSGAANLNGGALRLQDGVSVTANQINIFTSGSTIGNASGSGTITSNIVDSGNTWNVALGSGVTINIRPTAFAAGFVTGTLSLGSSAGDIRLTETGGFDGSKATFDLGSATARIFTRDNIGTVKLGALASTGPGTRLQGSGSTANSTVTYQIGDANRDTTYAGVIQQGTASNATLALTKTGTGTLRLTGDYGTTAYRGVTNVNGGALLVDGVHSPAANGAYTVNARLGGNGLISGAVTVNGGGTLTPGDQVGTLTLGTLTLNGGTGLDIEFNHSGSDRVDVKNTITTGATVNVNPIDTGGMTAGVYPILDYTGTSPGTGNLNLTSTSLSGFSLSLTDNTLSSSIQLVVGGSGPANEQWNIDADGNWTTGTNWTQGVIPNGQDYVANFSTAISAARTVTVSGNVSAAKVNFDTYSTTTGTYTIGGTGTITLNSSTGVGTISDQAGNHLLASGLTIQLASSNTVNVNNSADTLTVAAALAGAGNLTKSGRGTLALTGNNTYTGGTNVNAGTLTATKLSNGPLSVTNAFARITAKGTPNDPTGTTVVPSLALSGGTLDITNNALIIDYTTLGTQLTDIRGNLAAGRLTSSTKSASQAIGYADASAIGRTTFGGVALSDTTNIVASVVTTGDANLDGRVNAMDFNSLATNFGASGGVWIQGDFNYDGVVNTTDFTALATNFNTVQTNPPAPALGSLVPEPASLSAIVVLGLVGRRRRRG